MSRRENKILQKKNACEECSGSEDDENEVIQNEGEIEILKSDENMQAGESSDSEKKDFLFHLAKEFAEEEKKKCKNIDYNHPSPSTSQGRKTCQTGFHKRRNNICKYVRRLFAEGGQKKLTICVKDARNLTLFDLHHNYEPPATSQGSRFYSTAN
uniref:Uncharacterized protein n=1 Tax=Glossina austeni TaxID=7395 RepID=A0A1A9UVM7_GLOAU